MDCGFDSEDPLVIAEGVVYVNGSEEFEVSFRVAGAESSIVVMGRDPSLSLRMTVGKTGEATDAAFQVTQIPVGKTHGAADARGGAIERKVVDEVSAPIGGGRGDDPVTNF